MQEVEYDAPVSINDAVALLARSDSQVLAGGTDLLVQMRAVPPRHQRLVDVKRIPELVQISLDSSGLRLGSAVSCWEISQHKGLRESYPGLVEAVGRHALPSPLIPPLSTTLVLRAAGRALHRVLVEVGEYAHTDQAQLPRGARRPPPPLPFGGPRVR